MNNNKLSDEDIKKIGILIAGILSVLLLFISYLAYGYHSWTPREYRTHKVRIIGSIIFILLALASFFLLNFSYWINASIFLNLLIASFLFYTFPYFESIHRAHKIKKNGITTNLLHQKRFPVPKLSKIKSDEKLVPIGFSMITGKIHYIEKDSRIMHVLILGATGMGKSTLLLVFALHSIKHKLPSIIIDPKADNETLIKLKEFCLKFGRDPANVRVFDFANPKKSASYNPLKYGSANTVKDRIMESLTWSENYYRDKAGEFLSGVLPALEFLKIPFSIDEICNVLENEGRRNEIKSNLLKEVKNNSDAITKKILEKFIKISEINNKDLSGLLAQLNILNNLEFGHLLSFKSSDNEIDLRQAIKNNEIIYFKLNVLANKDSSHRIGKMILEDIKTIANEYFNISKQTFCPIYIDEFTEFADESFITFLRLCRGAGFPLHLFTQGLEDLDRVSTEFRRILVNNPLTKIIFRMDDPSGVNEIVSSIGTFDREEKSYQVSGEGMFSTKTGLGNLRDTKQVIVSHDAIKNLSRGQAIVTDKSPSTHDLVEMFQAKDLI